MMVEDYNLSSGTELVDTDDLGLRQLPRKRKVTLVRCTCVDS